MLDDELLLNGTDETTELLAPPATGGVPTLLAIALDVLLVAALDALKLEVGVVPSVVPPPQADSKATTAKAVKLSRNNISISLSQRSPLGFGDATGRSLVGSRIK